MAKKKRKSTRKESVTEAEQNPAASDVKALSRALARKSKGGKKRKIR
jgi:hypothetical protein